MRKSTCLVLLILGGVAATASARSKKDSPLPKLFCNARFVYVETYEGGLDNPQLVQEYPLDYNAAVGVEQRIRRWDRYQITPDQPYADLVFVVWKARPDGNRLPGQPTQMPPVGGPQAGNPGGLGNRNGMPRQNPQGGNPGDAQQQTPDQSPGGMGGPDGVGISHGGPGVAVYPTKDELAVYLRHQQTPLWKKSEKDGLTEPYMPLFRKLADAVDDSCPDAKGSVR